MYPLGSVTNQALVLLKRSKPGFMQPFGGSADFCRLAQAFSDVSFNSNCLRTPTSPPQSPSRVAASVRQYNSLNCQTPFQLCFLRHGQSTWNRDNRFIGWHDTPLTDDGVLEARVAGQMLQKSGILFDEVHTSLLRRSIRTGMSSIQIFGW